MVKCPCRNQNEVSRSQSSHLHWAQDVACKTYFVKISCCQSSFDALADYNSKNKMCFGKQIWKKAPPPRYQVKDLAKSMITCREM